MRRRIILTIAKKEFLGFINTPISFIIIIPFLFLSTFIYLRSSLVVGDASLRSYFELLPWFLTIVAPALSMKLISEEKKTGTIELLYAHPLQEFDIVVGKFIGVFAFYLVTILTTVFLSLSLLIFANPDPGVIVAQYLGAIFLGSLFLSVGTFSSATIHNPVGSFLLAASISFLFILIGLDFVYLMLPWPINRFIEEMAVVTHLTSFTRGAVDLRDVIYFVSVTSLFLALTIVNLAKRKTVEIPKEKTKLNVALILIICIGMALHVLMLSYPIRLDFTQQKLFTLSDGTRTTLAKLPDIVTVTIYASSNLPSELQSTYKEMTNILKDYQKLSKKIVVVVQHPDVDSQALSEANQNGIEEVTFNRIGSGKFEVQQGYLGLSLKHGDKNESIPYIADTTDLEYQLTSKIRKLIRNKELTVGVYIDTASANTIFNSLLKSLYTVQDLSIDDLQKEEKLKNLATVIVVDNGASNSTASSFLKKYFDQGGKMLVFANGVTVNGVTMTADKSNSTVPQFLSDYGVIVANDLVYDLQQAETLTFGGGNVRYLAPYPFWLRAQPQDANFLPTRNVKSITLTWPSSIQIKDNSGINVRKIFTTSVSAGRQKDNFNISPTKNTSLQVINKEQIPLGVYLEKGNGKVILIGNSEFLNDNFLQNFAENMVFINNSLEFLVSEQDIASIQRKIQARPVYKFESPIQIILYQYGNIIIPPLLVLVFAIIYLTKRRKGFARFYEN